jgi:hypothetical protein
VSDDLVAPDALAVGRVYRDDEGLDWVPLGRDERGAVRLTPPAEAPDWDGVLLERDGGWYEADRFVGYVEGLLPTDERAACRGCGASIVAGPGADPANHRPGCPWLTLAVRAVARGLASPTGRWLRPPLPGDVA